MDVVIAYLRAVRDKKNIDQQDLADAIGLSLRQTNRWENGGGKVSLKDEQLVRAIEFLGADFDHVRVLTRQDATDEQAAAFVEQHMAAQREEARRLLHENPVAYDVNQRLSQIAPNLTEDERLDAIQELSRQLLRKNPSKLDHLLAFVRGLSVD